MEDIGPQVLAIFGDDLAGVLVEDHEAGSVGAADDAMGVVHAIAGIDVKQIAIDEDRAFDLIVRVDAGDLDQISDPDDVGVGRSGRHERLPARSHVTAFLRERALVARGQAIEAQAHHLAAI